jgi:hypothetical protein
MLTRALQLLLERCVTAGTLFSELLCNKYDPYSERLIPPLVKEVAQFPNAKRVLDKQIFYHVFQKDLEARMSVLAKASSNFLLCCATYSQKFLFILCTLCGPQTTGNSGMWPFERKWLCLTGTQYNVSIMSKILCSTEVVLRIS